MAVSCAVCGYDNVPGTLFCEGCGSGLTGAASGYPLAARIHAETVVAPEAGPETTASARPSEEVPGTAVDLPLTAAYDDRVAAAPAAYLSAESGRRVEVPQQDVVIVGREDMRSGIRPDVDLSLDGAAAAGVSRRHCRLLRQGDGWLVEDLMSTNYTVLNGKPLQAHTPAPVANGDELRLGKLRLRFHTD